MYYSNKYFPHKSQICTSKYSEVLVLVVIINKVNIKHSYSLNLSFHHKTGICLFLKNLSKQDFFSLVLGIKFVTLYLPGRHLCRCAKSLTQNKIFSVGIVQWQSPCLVCVKPGFDSQHHKKWRGGNLHNPIFILSPIKILLIYWNQLKIHILYILFIQFWCWGLKPALCTYQAKTTSLHYIPCHFKILF